MNQQTPELGYLFWMIFSLCVVIFPTLGAWRYIKHRRASHLYKKGKYEKAYSLFNKTLLKNPERIDAYINCGICQVQLKNLDSAIGYFIKALDINDRDADANYNLANAYKLNKEYEKAHAIYDKLISFNETDIYSYVSKAILYGRHNPEKSIACYEKALQIKENDADLYCNLGLAHHWNNDFENASICYEQSLKINPNNVATLNNYGYLLSNYDKFDDAIQYLNKCITINPEFAFAYNNLGYCYLKKSDYKNAIDNIEISIALNNKNSYAYKNRALYYLAIHDKEKARADLNKALELGFTDDYGEEVNNLLGEMDKT